MNNRVVIDVGAWSQKWFQDILPELQGNERIVFVYSNCGRFSEEIDRVLQLRRFLSIQASLGRCEVAPSLDIEHYEKYLVGVRDFCNCEACDDPHIFSLVRVKGINFVFTSDIRINKCRKKMQGVLAQSFLQFRIITSARQYNQLKRFFGV